MHDPFIVNNDNWITQALRFPGQTASESDYKLAACDLQSRVILKQFEGNSIIDFWIKSLEIDPSYDSLRRLAILVFSAFGSTYICECCFSTVNSVKTKHRSRLSLKHLSDCVRLAVSNRQPDFKKISKVYPGTRAPVSRCWAFGPQTTHRTGKWPAFKKF